MPTISTRGRAPPRAAQEREQFRGESYPALAPHRLVQLSISKAILASCDNRICRTGLSSGQT